MKISSDFAILDVKNGRQDLKDAIDNGQSFPVTLKGRITAIWGGDDGISREFQIDVDSIEIGADE